jgi:hypothetical protein
MRPSRNGVRLEMLISGGKPYYQIKADEYECGRCHHKTILGFAASSFIEHYNPDYASHTPDLSAEFAE